MAEKVRSKTLATEVIPTLGFTGVVMGMIGLAAYLMLHARVRKPGFGSFAWVNNQYFECGCE
jgi:hypothetical protein